MFGKLPIFNRLKIFGSLAFLLNRKASREKLDPKDDKYILLGNSVTPNPYRLLDLNFKKVKELVSVKSDKTVNDKQYKESQNEEISPSFSDTEVESEFRKRR